MVHMPVLFIKTDHTESNPEQINEKDAMMQMSASVNA